MCHCLQSEFSQNEYFFSKHISCLLEKPEHLEKTKHGRLCRLWQFWLKTPPEANKETLHRTLHIPKQWGKHGSWTSSSTKRERVGSNSSSSSPSSLSRCLLKIKGHKISEPYIKMHNNWDTSRVDCYLPHVVESSHIFVLSPASLTEDSDVLSRTDWKLKTQKKRLFMQMSLHLKAGGFLGPNLYNR